MAYFLTIGGLALLGIGGEALVRAAANLANRLRVSRLLVGLLVIALATSSPELAVAIGAALGGYPDIAVGNVVGSNIANILLVLSLGVLIFPMSCCQHVKERDLVVVLAVTGFFVWLSATRGEINAMHGGLMVVMLLLYVLYAYFEERWRLAPVGTLKQNLEIQETWILRPGLWGWTIDLLWLVGGAAALVYGAGLLVQGVTDIARIFGVWEGVIGLTVVAVGTSLPELATVIVAALRRHPEIAIGGVLGSNIFNILAVLGIASLIETIPVDPAFVAFDYWVMLAAALILIPVVLSRNRISRLESSLMLLAYLAYVAALYAPGEIRFASGSPL